MANTFGRTLGLALELWEGGAGHLMLYVPSLVDSFAGYMDSHRGLILVALVALAAFGKSQGWGLIGTVFRVAVPIASALTFAIWNGHGDTNSITAILVGLILLSIALYGIHGMIFGMFGKRRRRRRRETDD